MNKEAQDFERWLREKLHRYLIGRLDESKIVDADPPKDDHIPDTVKLIKEAKTEDK